MSAATAAHPVAADTATLERLAYDLFCQAVERGTSPRRPPAPVTRSDGQRRSPEQLIDRRHFVPLGYRLWLAHLLWLEEVVHTLECRPAELTAAELAGLAALGRARARFLRAHQLCPHCEALNPRPPRLTAAPVRCRRCHQEL